jgi:signal transduction histidine kinase
MERFARGASAVARPGAGLGLASADALARRMGGRLVLARGPGGRATLELPAGTPPPAPPEAPAPAVSAAVA